MDTPHIRVAIVDDESLARERLRTFLAAEPDVAIVAECSDGNEAVHVLSTTPVDLLFLDIQIPGRNGFDVLRGLAERLPPTVIFVTAFDHHAVKAFEVHAVDYILKPFDRDRLRKAVSRARSRLGQGHDGQASMRRLLDQYPATPNPADRIVVKLSGRILLLQTSDIDWVGSADNYVELHAGAKTHLLRETMNSIAGRLPADLFQRISRTCIVNLRRVRELQPLFHGEYAVILNDGTRLTLSRSYRSQLHKFGL